MTPLCFVDTETTGVHPGRRAWEIALIREDRHGITEKLIQIRDIDLSEADPVGLKIGKFYDRHAQYGPQPQTQAEVEARGDLLTERQAAHEVERLTRGAHLVGAVPSFDAEVLDAALRRHQMVPAWHYHLIDVEAMAVGWLAAKQPGSLWVDPPWRSDELARAVAVISGADLSITDQDRHTALGDARWAMSWYNAMVGVHG